MTQPNVLPWVVVDVVVGVVVVVVVVVMVILAHEPHDLAQYKSNGLPLGV